MERCYLYAVVDADSVGDLTLSSGGVKGAPVTTVPFGAVAAVVSPLGQERVRGSRADLSAHELVVEDLAATTTVLPLQFGVVLQGETAVVEDFLAPNEEELRRMVAALAGRTEHRLKARYLGDVALREAVEGSAEIRRLHQRIQGRGGEAAYHDRIRLGELVAAALDAVKARDAARILQRLERVVEGTVVLGARRDDVAVHAAFLVSDAGRAHFDEAVDSLARELSERMSFELVGPLAAWDFVSDDLASGRGTDGAGYRRR